MIPAKSDRTGCYLAPDESSLVFNDKQDHEAPSTLMSKMAAPSRQPSTWWIGWNPGHGTTFYDVAYPTLCPFFYRNPNESAKGQLLGWYLTVNSSKSKDVVGYIVEWEHSNAARSRTVLQCTSGLPHRQVFKRQW